MILLALGALALPLRAADTSNKISLSTTTTASQPLTLPDPARPSIVLFLRPGQAQSDDAIKSLAILMKTPKDVQIVGIVSGDDAQIGVSQLAKSWHYPLVVDPDYTTSGKFAVRVWPTTVVLTKAGEIVAHEAGLPVTYENDLSAYVDFASGKIDKAALDKALADRSVMADSKEQKASRHVEVAQRLAAKGMLDDARAEIVKAVELQPTDPQVILALARVQLMVGDAKSADALLGQSVIAKSNNIPPGEIHVLQGWSAILQNDWPTAEKLLSSAAQLNPDPAEAFYLLARVYEHQNNPAKAAEFFRKAYEHTDAGKSMGTIAN
jgi:Flp pilus assembly protein TadD